MKKLIIASCAAVVMVAAALPTSALAWHGHTRVGVGVYLGGPIYGPGYYRPYPYYWGGAPYYYYPPPVVTVPVPTTPPVYIEQSPQSAAPSAPANPTGYWYYCANPAGYYPTVKACTSDWQRVAPLPAQ